MLNAPNYTLDSTLGFKDDYFVLDIASFHDKKREVKLDGQIVVSLDDSKMYSKFSLSAGDVTGLNLYLYSNRNALTFSLTAHNPIPDLGVVANSIALPHNISKWMVDYASGEHIVLKQLNGVIPYKDPSAVLRTLYGEATYQGLSYTFNQKTEPIRTAYTDLVFQDGILNIYPKEATFYAHDTGSSWLNIDFKAKQTLLTAFIKTDVQLDRDMLNLLESYNIRLPFEQTRGKTATDLKLAVILASGATTAQGSFNALDAGYRYQGLDLDVKKAAIELNNADVTVESLDIGYGEYLHANVQGLMNPVSNDGHLKINADRIRIGAAEKPLQLSQQEMLHIDYILSKGKDTIIIEPSTWEYGSHGLTFDAMSVPYDFDASVATLKDVTFNYNDAIRSTVTGSVDFLKQLASLRLDLKEARIGDVVLTNAPLSLDLEYKGQLHVTTDTRWVWDINGTLLTVEAGSADLNGTHLSTSSTHFHYGPDINGSVSTVYELETSTAIATFDSLKLSNESLGSYFALSHPVTTLVHLQEGYLYVASEDLDLSYSATPKRWDLSFYSLSHLAEHSPLLHRYHLNNGYLQLGRDHAYEQIGINAGIEYPYPLTVDESGPVSFYELIGQYTPDKLRLTLNETLRVDIDDKVNIESDGIGYNLGAILKVINTEDTVVDADTVPELNLNARNSFIYFTPQRRAVAESISLYTNDSGLYARLKHREGMAIFELKDRKFYLYGTRFGDHFMSHLLALAKYRGGELSFHVNGTTDEAHGVMRVKKTVIKDYKLMNNILAFINTVPSLATFSLPHYSDKGMEVKNAYASFHYKEGLVKVDGVKVDSQEIDIAGNGVVDYVNETVNMKLNLITDAGENVSKIPIVGYILVGEKGDVTTTLKISGDMNDPKVSSDIAKGIVVAPFKMILRTITLPFSIFDKKEKQQ
ncbi:MAG: AsmA-like C-terminal domain-containing protein [Sulfurimonadaceae bacterium]|nr:AsmA-like C-terminal domain-containing protein [Sulfurimonadaceae bacterium]